MSRLPLALTLAACALAAAAAEKKPVTLEALEAERPARAQPGTPVWSPDGSRFVFHEGGKLRLYEVASKSKRDLVAMSAVAAAATAVPKSERFEFENRGVREQDVQWMPSGKELLLSAGG